MTEGLSYDNRKRKNIGPASLYEKRDIGLDDAGKMLKGAVLTHRKKILSETILYLEGRGHSSCRAQTTLKGKIKRVGPRAQTPQ